MSGSTTFIFFKPFGVLSQFTSEAGHRTLAEFGPFPKDVYPAGRLDLDSEGLLVLTSDKSLQHHLTDPKYGHSRTYWVQVDRIPDETALTKLRSGLIIEGKKTLPSLAHLLEDSPILPDRPVPIRIRKNIPTAWLEITLCEGRNRQVRKMTAAVGHPALRLVRVGIGNLSMGNMQPGEWRELTAIEIQTMLGNRQGSSGIGRLGD
jgi:23S rRNA pseudouridine2457 synthase